jgi:hypothetical protein
VSRECIIACFRLKRTTCQTPQALRSAAVFIVLKGGILRPFVCIGWRRIRLRIQAKTADIVIVCLRFT